VNLFLQLTSPDVFEKMFAFFIYLIGYQWFKKNKVEKGNPGWKFLSSYSLRMLIQFGGGGRIRTCYPPDVTGMLYRDETQIITTTFAV